MRFDLFGIKGCSTDKKGIDARMLNMNVLLIQTLRTHEVRLNMVFQVGSWFCSTVGRALASR